MSRTGGRSFRGGPPRDSVGVSYTTHTDGRHTQTNFCSEKDMEKAYERA